MTGLRLIPLDELGRPRIDVTVRISGFFRDAFPHLVTLLDDAVALVAALDEPDEDNYVAAHARADAARLLAELDATPPGAARRRACSDQSPGPTALVCCSCWTRATGAATPTSPPSTRRGAGTPTAAASTARPPATRCATVTRAIELAVKNVDSASTTSSTPTTTTSTTAGWSRPSARLSGREPAAYVGDSSDPSRVRTRTLTEETRRVFRARVANPRWIASMIRHGYKGAAELAATVDYLFGYDAMAGVAEDWMYEQVAERYLLDPAVAEFMSRSNPWAARAIAERLLEAAERGMWAAPDDDTLSAIRERFLALEGELEEGVSRVTAPRVPADAIVGQEQLIEALLINAVAPEVGGVLVRGERGTAKSTAVRALASLLPAVDRRPERRSRSRPASPLRAASSRSTQPWSRGRRRWSSCRSGRRSTGSSARSTSAARSAASTRSSAGLLARAHRGHPVRRRGQPARRPSRRRAARRGRDRRRPGRARGGVGHPRGALPARRDDEPRGGRTCARSCSTGSGSGSRC